MAAEHEFTLLGEAARLHDTITDIDTTLKGTEAEFGPAPDLHLHDLGEIIDNRAFFEARRQTIVAQLAGESLIAAQRAA